MIFPDFSLTFPVCSKFPDFSLTGKCLPIFPDFPGFPVWVGTLTIHTKRSYIALNRNAKKKLEWRKGITGGDQFCFDEDCQPSCLDVNHPLGAGALPCIHYHEADTQLGMWRREHTARISYVTVYISFDFHRRWRIGRRDGESVVVSGCEGCHTMIPIFFRFHVAFEKNWPK